MKSKIIIICSIVMIVIAFTIFVGVSFAVFSEKDMPEMSITVGNINVTLEEDFSDTDEFGTQTDEKSFKIISEGNRRTYVRASIYTTVEYYDEDTRAWIAYAIDQANIKYTIDESEEEFDWIYSDGYYYYNKILYLPDPNNKTSEFKITNIEVKSLPDDLEGKRIRYNMQVKAEGSQATHESYLRNFNIAELPKEVEVLS